ncbi:hypothetical protein [Fluviispira sanaruensis]|uniref:Ketopantoate reductase N-terminal domain-containing protein n=1 Tax=Fluviispira sanaruensis TaxID=2493639 RepID=A0A4P2VN56_FLUSA|nr:hypothetical protein [Fluviispira sanaruensis]BBH54278.1 hypothetical protein JCM31447_27420 [Fluviispira sanaruensis]
MLSRTERLEIVNSHNSICRFVIGAGAVGLFLAHTLKIVYPQDSLYIMNKSRTVLPLTIEYVDGRQFQSDLQAVLLNENPQNIFSKIKSLNIYFYVTLPPENAENVFVYILKILKGVAGEKIITIIFLNNGFVDKKKIENFKIKLSKKGFLTIHFIRALIIAGYMRTRDNAGTLVKNTGGNKIFYGTYNNEFIDSNNIFPKEFYSSIYDKDIFLREKAKFITNLLLGLIINNKLLENRKVFTIIPKDKLDKTLENFCNLFGENEVRYDFIREQFLLAVHETGGNINSISYAWYHGKRQTIDYFVSELKSFMKKSKNKSAIHFMNEIIKEYY